MSLYQEPNITDLDTTFSHVNIISKGAFGIGLPLTVFAVILFVGLAMKQPKSITFTVASLVYTIISILMVYGSYLNPIFAVAGIFMVAGGVVWMRIEDTSGN